jgi:hypothetical protein
MAKYKNVPSDTQIPVVFATFNFPKPLFTTHDNTSISIPHPHISKTLSQDTARVGLPNAMRKAFVSSCHLLLQFRAHRLKHPDKNDDFQSIDSNCPRQNLPLSQKCLTTPTTINSLGSLPPKHFRPNFSTNVS